MQNTLKTQARKLRLSGLLDSLELRLQEAESNRLPYSQFLELVFQDELDVRISRQVARRNKAACFRDKRSLEDFDFSFNPSVPRGQRAMGVSHGLLTFQASEQRAHHRGRAEMIGLLRFVP